MTFKTKLEALYATRNHWQYLAITGFEDKGTYTPSKSWRCLCACCEYSMDYTYLIPVYNCGICPLKGYWLHDHPNATCEEKGTFYDLWCYVEDEVDGNNPEDIAKEARQLRKFYAHRMVYACNQAIEAELLREVENPEASGPTTEGVYWCPNCEHEWPSNKQKDVCPLCGTEVEEDR